MFKAEKCIWYGQVSREAHANCLKWQRCYHLSSFGYRFPSVAVIWIQLEFSRNDVCADGVWGGGD